jgi:glycerol-3-phosphate O-acyltransferase
MATEDGARLGRDLAGAPTDPAQPGPVRDVLRRLVAERHVKVETAADETIYQVLEEHRPLLDYHRNAVIHRYVAPSLVAAAVRATSGGMSGEAVRARALWLSRLFKLEFMYRVGATHDEIFAHTAANLMRLGAVVRVEEDLRPGPEADTLTFLAELTRPYLEAYRVAAGTALAVTRRASVDRRVLLREAFERGRASFLSGEIVLRESLSKATLSNAFEWMVNQGLLVEVDGGKVRLADRSGAGLLQLVEGIARFLA